MSDIANEKEGALGPDAKSSLGAAVAGLIMPFQAADAAGRQQRRLPRAQIDAMRAAGLYRVYNPTRWGGFELHMDEVLPLVAQLAEGCPASAWVLAGYQIHPWVISLFAEQAQTEVFGSSRDPVVCASLNPSNNRARKVPDGDVIEHGRFTFCSGAAAREWALLGALITDDAGAVVDVGCLLVPGTELTELDDWLVCGLQATGSLSLVAQDLFIPAHRFLSYLAATAYRTPGAAINRGSVYQAAFVPMLVLNLAGPALGAAEFALRAFIANLNDKGAAAGAYPLPGLPRIEAPATHEVIATARMQIDSARLLTAQAGRTIRQAAEARCPLTPAQSAKVNLETSYAVRECLRAVQSLFLQAGGGVLHPSHPLQGAYQDVLAINCHGFLAHEANLTLYGSLVTGHAQPTAFL